MSKKSQAFLQPVINDLKAAFAKANIPSVEKKAVSGKFFDTTIRFKKAPLAFLKELKTLSDNYELEYELIENIEL